MERDDQRVGAVEVKLSRTVGDEDVRHLLGLRERLGEGLFDAVVVTAGPEAYRRPDGVAVVHVRELERAERMLGVGGREEGERLLLDAA